MARISYSEDQITEYVELAQEIGHGPARRELGYPKHHATAQRWAEARGVEVDVDTLRQRAAETKKFYTAAEGLVVAQEQLNRLYEAVMDDGLDAEALNKLSNAIHKTVQTIQLLKGDVTNRSEKVETTQQDIAIRNMLAEVEARNKEFEEEYVS